MASSVALNEQEILKKSSSHVDDPLNWEMAAESLRGSHFDEVKKMVDEFRMPIVKIGGENLTVAQVASIANADNKTSGVKVEISESSRADVEASSDWILDSIRKGIDICGITTGFGANSDRRTNDARALQNQLIK